MPKSSSLQLARTVYYTLAHRLYPTPILQALVVAQVQVVEQVVVLAVRLRVRQPHGAGSRQSPTPPFSTYC